MLATASSELPHNTNPLAEADEKENYSTSLNVNPEFQMVYQLLGMDNDQTKLTYDGRITFSVQNSDDDQYSPASLASNGWADNNANQTQGNFSKSSSVTTTHQLTFIPHFKREGHSVMSMLRFQVQSNNNKGQNNNSSQHPSRIKLADGEGKINGMGTSAGQGRGVNGVFSIHYSFRSKYSADFTLRADGSTKFGDNKRWGLFPALSGRWNIIDEDFMETIPSRGRWWRGSGRGEDPR